MSKSAPTPPPKEAPPSSPRSSLYSPLRLIFKSSVLVLILSLFASKMITGDSFSWGYDLPSPRHVLDQVFPPQEKLFTIDQLRQYDGKDASKPVYLAILGNVYDVSNNRATYGPGGGYAFFAGRDASRAYVTGCFKEDGGHLTHDVRGLDSNKEKRSLQKWNDFFEYSPKYKKIGRVLLPPIDPSSPIPGPCPR